MRLISSACLLSLLLCAPVRADVLIVNGEGGGAFPDLQQAIDAAQVGDTILVAANLNLAWQQVVLDGKGIDILVDGYEKSFSLGKLTVRNIPAGQRVTIRGAKVPVSLDEEAAVFSDNAGTVRLFYVGGTGQHGVAATESAPGRDGSLGARFINCAEVLMVESGFGGGTGGPALGPIHTAVTNGGTGAWISHSKVVGFRSYFRGGTGGFVLASGSDLPGSAGGTGLIAENSTLVFHGNLTRGGDGGDTVAAPGGPGGDGLVQIDSTAWTVTQHASGAGGPGGKSSWNSNGPAGTGEVILAGTRTELAPDPGFWTRSAWVKTPVRANDPIELTVGGFNDDVWLLLSLGTGTKIMPALNGALVLGPPLLGQPLLIGHVPFFASTFTLGTAPALPPGMDLLDLQLQVVTHSAVTGYQLGSPDQLVILGSGF